MHLCYQVKADHRKPKWNSKVKSLWTAIEYHEIDIFSYGLIKSWIPETSNKEIVWSFHRDSNENKILKIGEDHRNTKIKNLGLAKFTKDNNNTWHGYPIDPVTDPIPNEIIQKWSKTIGVKLAQRINKGKIDI